jgi:hypothetical protein
MLGQEVAVELVVLVGEKGPGPAVAALSDVMRNAGEDGASEAGHEVSLAGRRRPVN